MEPNYRRHTKNLKKWISNDEVVEKPLQKTIFQALTDATSTDQAVAFLPIR